MSDQDENTGPTEAGVIAELARQAETPHLLSVSNPDGSPRTFLVRGENTVAEDVTDPNGQKPWPRCIDQRVTVQTLDSLVDYAVRFQNDATLLFADISANRITAAIDYHAPEQAKHVQHVATMDLPYSEEWRAWTAIDGKLMGQLEFARYLEENAPDIAAPSGAELLEVCRDIQAVRKADFRQAVRTASDNEDFTYEVTTEATTRKGNFEIPHKFELQIPVYFNGRSVPLGAFLRWTLDDGKLKLGIALHRPEHVRQAVFREIVLEAQERTGRQALFAKAP